MRATELRAWRNRLSWTQAEAAAALGLNRTHYIALEQGRSPIRRVLALATIALEQARADPSACAQSLGAGVEPAPSAGDGVREKE